MEVENIIKTSQDKTNTPTIEGIEVDTSVRIILPKSRDKKPSHEMCEGGEKCVVTKKPKKTRVLIENLVLNKDTDYNPELQWEIFFGNDGDGKTDKYQESLRTIILRHISIKIQSYKTQDQKNKILDTIHFVDIEFVINLLKKSKMRCFYCKEWVQLLYQHVREPKQWTLERINNDIGHNKDNVEIACLSCNLRRRCMYHERFLFTKQMKIIKSDG